jgi:cytochrome b subunit of formate dehydrogenase
MFRIVSIVAFGATIAGIILHGVALPWAKGRRWDANEILRKLVCLLTLLFLEQKLAPVRALRKLVYLLALLCLVVLAVTGFYPTLVLGEHISGYLVMVHATFAPVFAVCLAVLAVMWAGRCRFTYSDWPWFQSIVQRVTLIRDPSLHRKVSCGVTRDSLLSDERRATNCSSGLGQNMTFWLLIFLALPLILSIVLSMFPLFGTHHQEILLALHGYVALVFTIVAIVHIYLVIQTKMKDIMNIGP